MQQTSGSSVAKRTDGDETAVDEATVDEVAVVVLLCFLFMVCGHCGWSTGPG